MSCQTDETIVAAAGGKSKSNRSEEAKLKKMQKTLEFLFTQDGLTKRNIPHDKDSVFLDDILASEHFKNQQLEEVDFENAVPTSLNDERLKENSRFLLVTEGGRKSIKFCEDGFAYEMPAELKEPLQDSCKDGNAEVTNTAENVTVLDHKSEEEEQEEEEVSKKSLQAPDGQKASKKNKKKKKGKGQHADNERNEPEKIVPADMENDISATKDAVKSGKCAKEKEKAAAAGGNQEKNKKDSGSQNDADKAEKKITGQSSASERTISEDGKEDMDGFKNAGSKKKTKKPADKSNAENTSNSTAELKQNKDTEKKSAVQDLKKPEEQKSGFQSPSASVPPKDNSKQKGKTTKKSKAQDSGKGKQQSSNSPDVKKSSQVESRSSDEEMTPSVPSLQESKKQKKKAKEDPEKKMISTFNFLFAKDGLKEKNISVGEDGFVRVQSIREAFADQYDWEESEVKRVIGNLQNYILQNDACGNLIIKIAAVVQPTDNKESHNENDWEDTNRKKKLGETNRQDDSTAEADKRPKDASSNTAKGTSKPRYHAPVPREKICQTLFWLLAKGGAAELGIPSQKEGTRGFLIKDIIQHFSGFGHYSVDEIAEAAKFDDRGTFSLSQLYGETVIRLIERQSTRKMERSDFHLSKTMSFLLRHGAERLNLPIQPDGFIFVDVLLNYNDLRGYSEEDVRRVVQNNDKKRFLLAEDPQTRRLKVRANQGHTIEVPDLELEQILNAADAPVVVHGTYKNVWQSIKREGLKRMGRNHIHFAAGEPGAEGVISGMRGSSEILIYIDMAKALSNGLKFFRSANNVILSPGDDNGVILPTYFSSAVQRNPRMLLL